jgi:hypothetical protein
MHPHPGPRYQTRRAWASSSTVEVTVAECVATAARIYKNLCRPCVHGQRVDYQDLRESESLLNRQAPRLALLQETRNLNVIVKQAPKVAPRTTVWIFANPTRLPREGDERSRGDGSSPLQYLFEPTLAELEMAAGPKTPREPVDGQLIP